MRPYYLMLDETMSDTQAPVKNIDTKDPISAITIIYEATNGATSNQGHPLHKDVDSIQVVDGSDTLFSMNGELCQALNFYESQKLNFGTLDEGAAATQREIFTIRFGRFIGDPELYLDPTWFTNLQLKLSHTLEISATAGFATGTCKVTAIVHLFEERPPGHQGFLMSKDVYSFTSAASGDEPVELPLDYPYRFIIVRAYESGVAFTTSLTRMKLTMDSDKFVPYDLYTDDLVDLNEEWFGKFTLSQKLFRTDNDSVEAYHATVKEAHVDSNTDFSIANAESITADTVTLQVLDLTATPTIAKATADRDLSMTTVGTGPHNCYCLPFGDPQKFDTWFKAMEYKSMKLKLTQGNAGATCNVVIQQLRTR